MRIRMEETGDVVELDAIATMCAIAEGHITGTDARCAAAMIFAVERDAGMLPGEEMDLDEYMASHARLLKQGFVGYDEHGGYLTAQASNPEALATLAGS